MPSGKLVHVEDRPIGTAASSAVATGQTVLPVDWAARFPPGGGTVDIAGVDYRYVSADHAANTITLATALTVAVIAGEQITLLNGGDQLAARDAWVILPGAGEPIIVAVPFAMQPLVPVGNEASRYADPWPVVVDANLTQLVDVASRPAQLDPDVFPPGSTLTDDAAPSSSPTPVVVGSIASLFVSWAAVANIDPVTYDVHLSTVDDFSPSALTLVASTAATLATISAFPDGTPLAYGATYHVKIVARDHDGAAAPSLQATGQLRQVTGPDVAASYVYANSVLASQVLSGSLSATIALLGKIQTSAAGGRNVLISTADGLQVVDSTGAVVASIPTDSALDIVFTMSLIAKSITATGPVSMRSAGNELARDSVLNLRASTSPPVTAPTVTVVYGSTPLTQPASAPVAGSLRGGWHDGSVMWVTDSGRVLGWNTSTGTVTSWALTNGAFASGGVVATGGAVKIGTNWYVAVLAGDGVTYTWSAYVYDDATKTLQSTFVLQTVPFYELANLGDRKLAITTDGANLLVVRSKPATSVRVNLMPNPSFEGQGTTQYTTVTPTRSSVALVGSPTGPGPTGLLFHVQTYTAGFVYAGPTLYTPWAPVAASTVYYVGFNYLINGLDSPQLNAYARFIDAGGNLISESFIGSRSNGSGRLTFAFTTPAGTAYVQLRLAMTAGQYSGGVRSADWYVDGFQVEAGATDLGYFDANYADDAATHYQWGGTGNLSPSYRVVNDHQAEVATFTTAGAASGALVTLTTSTGAAFGWGPILSLISSAADFGSSRLIVASSSAVVFSTAGAEQPDNDFPLAVPSDLGPMVWDGSNSRFCSLVDDGATVQLRYYSGNVWAAGTSATWYVTTTWRKATTYETVQGPAAVLTMLKRAFLQVASPPIPTNASNPDAPDSVSIYVGRTDGSRTTQIRQANPAAGVASLVLPAVEVFTTDATHPNPLAAGTFPTGTAGKVVSDASDGDGSLVQLNGKGEHRLAGKSLFSRSVALNLVGAWTTSAPGATTGTQFTCAAGRFRGIFGASAYWTAASTLLSVDLYIDGVVRATSRGYSNEAGSHKTLVPGAFDFDLDAGTHYAVARVTSGTSDTNDFAYVSGNT